MKNIKKVLLFVLLSLCLVATGVFGTLAYLKSITEQVDNTFTVGKVKITLDEAKIDPEKDEDGNYVAPDKTDRVQKNTYAKLMPGTELDKDPTIHIDPNSEDCYIFLELGLDKALTLGRIGKANNDWDANQQTDGNTLVALFAAWFKLQGFTQTDWIVKDVKYNAQTDHADIILSYKDEKVAASVEDIVVFTHLTIPEDIKSEQFAQLETENGFHLTFKAYAIQAAGLTAAEAYAELFPQD